MARDTSDELKDDMAAPDTDAEFRLHRQLVFWLFIATSVVVAITGVALIALDRGVDEFKGLSILVLVAVAGALGAFVSALRRLYLFENIFPSARYGHFLKGTNLYVIAYSSIPPLVGVIAAVVLYLVFAATLLSGSVFPAFECELGQDNCKRFKDFVKYWKPANAHDYAKALVWAFFAGFSERVVPDILNRLGAKTDDDRPGR